MEGHGDASLGTGGVRTSCWGGTGNCIVKTSPNVEEAWKFLQYSMLSTEGNVLRYEMTSSSRPSSRP